MDVISKIPDDQWDTQASPVISTSSNTPTTYREVVNYHAYDDAWVPETFTGKTMQEVGTKYDGDLLKDNPKENYKRYAQTALDFMKTFTDLDATIHFSYGDYSAAEGLNHIILFRALRAIEFGRAFGLPVQLPEELAQGMYEFVKSQEDILRQYGVIGQALSVSDTASYQDKLLAITGREP